MPREVLDASGQIVAPGFVDLHTHYDPFPFFDPWCSLSGWHGVTSVVIGNCGFGFAPARPDHQEYLMRTLNRVEAISYEMMKEVLPWSWESFPQWLDVLDATPKGVNMLSYVPLNPLLINVMGVEGAKTRDPDDDELRQLQRLLREALDAGACGWSAQRTAPRGGADSQRDFDGTSFPTDVMSNETALALGEVLSDYDHAFIQIVLASGDPEGDLLHLEELARVSNSGILYNGVLPIIDQPDASRQLMAWIRSCQARGLKMYGQAVSSGTGFIYTVADGWNLWDDSDAWREATLGTIEERVAKLKDPARRAALLADPPSNFSVQNTVLLRTYSERFMPAKGTLMPDAARILGYDNPSDCLLDIIAADEGRTLLQTELTSTHDEAVREIVTEPFVIWGVSDGGAHQKFLTTGVFTTESIIKFVREKEWVSLEEAHYRLSALPAHCAGLKDRGRLVPGAPADIVVYDFENLTLLPSEVAYDLPAGDWRRIQKAEGYRYTLVNGNVTFEDGKCTQATPGRLLRHGEG